MRQFHSTRCGGFSLVELMIGMVVGLFLLAGIVQIYLSNKASFNAQQTQAELQENARVSSFVLDLIIGHTGFRPNAFEDEEEALTAAALAGNEGDSGTPDSLTASFVSDGRLHDCLGNLLPLDTEARNEFRLQDAGGGLFDLMCESERFTPGTGTVNLTRALVSNVETMQFLYGLDTDGDNTVNRYVDADGVGANFSDVLSVRVALVLVTENNLRPEGGPQKFSIFGGAEQAFGAANDLRQRELVEYVVALRNRLE